MDINEILINEPEAIKRKITFAVNLITLLLSKLSFAEHSHLHQQNIMSAIKSDQYSRILCLCLLQNPKLTYDIWYRKTLSDILPKNEDNVVMLSEEDQDLIIQKHDLFVNISNVLVEYYNSNSIIQSIVSPTERNELQELFA